MGHYDPVQKRVWGIIMGCLIGTGAQLQLSGNDKNSGERMEAGEKWTYVQEMEVGSGVKFGSTLGTHSGGR